MQAIDDKVAVTLFESEIESAVGQVLQRHYNGWRWYVDCRAEAGIVTVRNLSLHGDYGFVIPLRKLQHDVDLKTVVLAGGEILERYNQQARWRPEVVDLPRDIKGNAIGDTDGAAYGL